MSKDENSNRIKCEDINMKIEILGTGCSKCKKTKETIEKVVKQSGVEAEVVKVEEQDAQSVRRQKKLLKK
jgi:hypothetical protein